MRATLKEVKWNTEGTFSSYQAILESPGGKELIIHFKYLRALQAYLPLKVNYDGQDKRAKLAWYSSDIEKMSVHDFLEEIAERVNQAYGYEPTNTILH